MVATSRRTHIHPNSRNPHPKNTHTLATASPVPSRRKPIICALWITMPEKHLCARPYEDPHRAVPACLFNLNTAPPPAGHRVCVRRLYPAERGAHTPTLGVRHVNTDAGTNVGAVVRSVLVWRGLGWFGMVWDRLAALSRECSQRTCDAPAEGL